MADVVVNGVPHPIDGVAGRAVTTVEGLAAGGRLHPAQQALVEEGASRCGDGTPAMAVPTAALLEADPDPDDDAVAAALGPDLCRCGCYPRIGRAVHRAAGRPRARATGAGALRRPRWPGASFPPRSATTRPSTVRGSCACGDPAAPGSTWRRRGR